MSLSRVLIPREHEINGHRANGFLSEDNVSISSLMGRLLVERNGLSTILAGRKRARASVKIFQSTRHLSLFMGMLNSEKQMHQIARTDLTRFALRKLNSALHTAGTKGRSVLDLERALPSSWSSRHSQWLGQESRPAG